jgi:signal transduction histidine kinase
LTTSAHPVDADFSQLFTSGLRRHIGAIRRSLDVLALLLAIAAFYQVGDPDLLLHAVFLILAVQAFMGGLRVTLLRIGAGTIAVFGYASFASGAATQFVPLELTEWPLMVAIAVLVAILADRVGAASAQYARLYRAASDRLFTAQEDERRRVALELHDGVGQTLTALGLTLDAVDSLMWAGDVPPPQHARDALRRAQELTTNAVDETRDLSFRLRPTRIAETGLVASLIELSRSAGANVEARIAPDVGRADLREPRFDIEVYRIVQEALGNALRHARATRIRIDVWRDGDVLSLSVVDDGVGIDSGGHRRAGLGLPGMAERALVIGGVLTIDSTPGSGTKVLLRVPLQQLAPAGAGIGTSATGAGPTPGPAAA